MAPPSALFSNRVLEPERYASDDADEIGRSRCVDRGDDRGGIACRAFVNELRGRDTARLFTRADDLRRYRRFGPEIVDRPVKKTLEEPSIRSDASRHRDVEDDQRAPCDTAGQEVGI